MGVKDHNDTACPISTAVPFEEPRETDFPDAYRLAVRRMKKRIAELEWTIRDKDDRIVHALGAIERELTFWRTFLHDHVGETYGQIRRRVANLEGLMEYIKAPQHHVYPDLDMPAQWKKKNRGSK